MPYTRVNWNSTSTFVSNENLNVMDKGIKDLDTNIGEVTALKTTAKTVVPAINELSIGLKDVNNNLTTLNDSLGTIIINKSTMGTTIAKTVESLPINSHLIKDFWTPLSDMPATVGDYYVLDVYRGSLVLEYARIILTSSTKLWIGHYASGTVTWAEK